MKASGRAVGEDGWRGMRFLEQKKAITLHGMDADAKDGRRTTENTNGGEGEGPSKRRTDEDDGDLEWP
jgi:hypothetical protein